MDNSGNQNQFNHIDYDGIKFLDLFFSPKKFFTQTIKEGNRKYIYFVTLILGISAAITRFDYEMVKSNIGTDSIFVSVAESWLTFWIACILLGLISSLFIWYFGGWWYRMRIYFSGVNGPDKYEARYVFIYSSFVSEGPNILVALIYTAVYSNYIEASLRDEFLYIIAICFLFISLVTSYIGAINVFDVSKWKAKFWFIILPAIFYLFLIGTFGLFMDYIAEEKYIETTAIPADREITSEDSLTQLTLPSDWEMLKDLADETSFQIGNLENEAYCIVFSEYKADLEISIDEYLDLVTSNLLVSISDSTVTDFNDYSSTDYSTRTLMISGKMDYMNLSYVFHIVETELYFHQMVFWTLEWQTEEQLPVFNNVIESFREITME